MSYVHAPHDGMAMAAAKPAKPYVKKAPKLASPAQREWIGRCMAERKLTISQRERAGRALKNTSLSASEAHTLLDELFKCPKLTPDVGPGLYYHDAMVWVVKPNKSGSGCYALALMPYPNDPKVQYKLVYDPDGRRKLTEAKAQVIGLEEIPAGILAGCSKYALAHIEEAAKAA